MSRKHAQMEHLDDGNSLSDDLDDDEDKYMKTIEYWKHGKLGTVFQTFLEANDVIDNSDLTEEYKEVEKAKVLAARKIAFGKDFDIFPPWNSK